MTAPLGMAGPVGPPQPFTLWSDPIRRPGWLNMAIDSTLLERAEAGERWLRLYAWEPCLSFGRHEPAGRRYDADRIASLGISVVRRPTGGRAVWHDGELTYAVAAPCTGFGGLREAYEEIHLVLRDALRSLGAATELAPAGAAVPVDAGACFAAAAGGELLADGGKLVGSAQLRRGTALLQHGSVLLDGDQTIVGAVSRRGIPATGGGAERSSTLRRAIGREVGWEEAARSVVSAARRRWGVSRQGAAATPILERAEALAGRFRSPEWTWSGTASR